MGHVTMAHRLGRDFYSRPVLAVARDLVGKHVVSGSAEGVTVGRIVETEAYRGPEDRAAHSYGGRRTARTEAMFGPPGHAYVFLLYGLHWHLNIVTGAVDEPEAVLIRAVEPVEGVQLMAARRGLPAASLDLTRGPGRTCQALAIDGRHYAADLTSSSLTILDGPKVRVARSTRIGVDYAGEWAKRPWRFFDPLSRYVSRSRRVI
jgi:DNA-3-methyladenine glycosylase